MSVAMHAPAAGRPTVLIADDDDDLRGAIVDLLRDEAQFDVLEAHDGLEALQLAISAHPQAIILDQRMPGLSGLEVVDRLKAAGLHIPVILMTAARDVTQLAANLGLPCYLGKPFDIDDLLAMVTRAVAGHC
jgi:two-component system, response regulator, stage 0 sporulation protein F